MLNTLKYILTVSFFAISLNTYANELIPIETFFKQRNIISLKLSPTGQYFAAIVEIKGDRKLAVLDSRTNKILSLFEFDKDKDVGDYGWLNDERLFAEMVEKTGPLSQPIFTGFVFAGNYDGSRKIQLMPTDRIGQGSGERGRLNVVSMLRDDSEHILITKGYSAYPEVYKMNVYTGRKIKYAIGPKFSRVISDHDGRIRAAVASDPDDEKTTIQIRLNNEDKWKIIKTFDTKKIGMSPIAFTPDNKNIYMNVRSEGLQRGIYLFDTETLEFTLLKEISNEFDIEGYLYDKNYKAPDLIGYVQTVGKPSKVFFSEEHELAMIARELENVLPNDVATTVNYTKDGKKALIIGWSDVNPGSYYLFDFEKNNLEYLLDISPWIDRTKLASMTPITYKTRDGLEIYGYLTLPRNKSTNLPFVLMVHGGPYGQKDNWGYNVEAQFLANRGYAVLQVNYRGSGGRGAAFIYNNYRKMGKEMQDDLTDATLWAVEQGYADKNRLCIYGGSYGGYASLMGVAKEPDLYKCAIGYVGAYDIRAFKYDIYHRSKYGRKNEVEAWGYGDDDFMMERSPVTHVSKIKADLFIAHGRADKICPMEHYYSLTEALDKHKIGYKSMVKDHEGHGYRQDENVFEFYGAMEKFLSDSIGK